jgi:uncharacterized protein (DUF1786 family)
MVGDEEATVNGAADSISKRVVDIGRPHVYYSNVRGERVNLTAIHRMNMHYLRKRILDETISIFQSGEMTDENSKALTCLIQDYCMPLLVVQMRVEF